MTIADYKKRYDEIETDTRASDIVSLIMVSFLLIVAIIFVILKACNVINDTALHGATIGTVAAGTVVISRVFTTNIINQSKISKLTLQYLTELQEKGEE